MTCGIKEVLSDSEAELLRTLFQSIDRKPPPSNRIAKVDRTKSVCRWDCPYRFSWGFDHYCCSDEKIDEHVKKFNRQF